MPLRMKGLFNRKRRQSLGYKTGPVMFESQSYVSLKGNHHIGCDNSDSVTTNGLEMKIVNVCTFGRRKPLSLIQIKMYLPYVEDENGIILRNALPYLEEIDFPSLNAGQ